MTLEKKSGFLFNVEILVAAATQAKALAAITEILSNEKIKDYKIKNKTDVGKWIELIEQSMTHQVPSLNTTQIKASEEFQSSPEKSNSNHQLMELINHFKENNTLVRLSIVKGRGIRLSLPCRILNYDQENENVTVYHVDEKKVYLIKLNEIDDFSVS